MTENIFKHKFGLDPNKFETIEDMEKFVEEKTGKKITHTNQPIIPIVDMDADKMIDEALKNVGRQPEEI